jgi:hypothetical protein
VKYSLDRFLKEIYNKTIKKVDLANKMKPVSF